ncbi:MULTISPECIES: hypothetical protein [unclassified Levilactobacillus]|uniref:hypothetical protein n=1 Tax=unclassified Levilactobacillus TaxID=2767918 RepID=UPI002FF01F00
MYRNRRKHKDKAVRRVANTMVRFFQSYGIKVMRYNSYSTSSIYLKLDYGMLYTMRISDHRGKKGLNYRYNIIKGFHGQRYEPTDWGWKREFIAINPDKLNRMCVDILTMRADKLRKLGPYGYQAEMDYRQAKNSNNKGFWQQAKDLG